MSAFDPLDYENIGASISRALDDQPVQRLTELKTFDGAGVYALYYDGDFPAYAPLAEVNRANPGDWAIYIGKAEAENARKGEPNQANLLHGPKLYKRIQDHRKSIAQAENLDVEDFLVRALPVAPTWVPLAEVISIRMHQPVWNKIVDGLGNHDPGSGRYKGARPRWDTLHPGRPWAEKLQAHVESAEDISRQIETFLYGSEQYKRYLESKQSS